MVLKELKNESAKKRNRKKNFVSFSEHDFWIYFRLGEWCSFNLPIFHFEKNGLTAMIVNDKSLELWYA